MGRGEVVVLLLAASILGACNKGPCPSGQEPREERFPNGALKSKGCVGQDNEGNYRRQGRWEFFFANGQKQAEGEYKDAHSAGEKGDTGILKDGRVGRWDFWYENGQKSSEATFRAGKNEGSSTEWYEN